MSDRCRLSIIAREAISLHTVRKLRKIAIERKLNDCTDIGKKLLRCCKIVYLLETIVLNYYDEQVMKCLTIF